MARLKLMAVLFFALLFWAVHVLFFEVVDKVEISSVLSGGAIMLIAFATIVFIQRNSFEPAIFDPLKLGFSILFISLLCDTLDEIYIQPPWLELVFEDVLQFLGYAIVAFGLKRWVDHSQAENRKLGKLASTDELTGVFNRRYFTRSLNKEVERARRHHRCVSLIVFDLDFFKKVNDTHGHNAGDMALRHVVKLVRKHVRTSDVFARIGGEEFAVILPETDITGAAELANKIRSAMNVETVSPIGNVTASFGVAELASGETDNQFLIRADRALYSAKQQGRNCVITARKKVSSPVGEAVGYEPQLKVTNTPTRFS